MGLNLKKVQKFAISWLCLQILYSLHIQAEAETLSNYARMRSLLPKISTSEARLYANNQDHQYSRHPCERVCNDKESMTCYYYFMAHYDTVTSGCDELLKDKHRFQWNGLEYIDPFDVYNNASVTNCMYADGVQIDIAVINGQFPGQSIQVCLGDTLVVDVVNSLREITTVHWHGMHQRKAPHMDGVPHITQYPIEPGQAYRYRFEVDHPGTNWWHSHTNDQRAFGLAGPLIVHQTRKENAHVMLYDFDFSSHIIFIQDWMYQHGSSEPQNLLINGRGRYALNDVRPRKMPILYADFNVVRGGRYRFRAIYNGISNCPITLSVDQHDLIVISNDGNDIEPITTQKITFNAGERFDFVLHANQDVNNYWIRIKGHNFCAANKLHQQAILRYDGANKRVLPQGPLSYAFDVKGIEVNPVNKVVQGNGRDITILDMKALSTGSSINTKPYRTYYTSMNVDTNNNFKFQLDDITFKGPKVSILQSRNLGIGNYFCNKTNLAAQGKNCKVDNCQCTNVIHVPSFQNVEFVISSRSDSSHPIHLHGYTFSVVGMGILGRNSIDDIELIDRQKPLPRRNYGGPLKDTVQVPGYGYTIIRFFTDSPGYWLYHCHISPHAENGMAAVLRVGDDLEMKLCPLSNCGLCDSLF